MLSTLIVLDKLIVPKDNSLSKHFPSGWAVCRHLWGIIFEFRIAIFTYSPTREREGSPSPMFLLEKLRDKLLHERILRWRENQAAPPPRNRLVDLFLSKIKTLPTVSAKCHKNKHKYFRKSFKNNNHTICSSRMLNIKWLEATSIFTSVRWPERCEDVYYRISFTECMVHENMRM